MASILDSFRLDGRAALVTGGDKGIGQAMAIALAQAGANVAVTSRSGACDNTLTAIAQAGREGAAFAADFSGDFDARALVGDVVARFGSLDILVNNAGTIRRADALDFGDDDWRLVLEVNLNALWRLSQASARVMLPRGGKIVNVASVLSFQGGVRVPAYTAAKHAVVGLTKALANEWAAKHINVNAIAPGYIETDNTQALRADPARSKQILDRIPAGRWGATTDLMGAAVFLAAPASDYMHGHVLVVDGGWLAR